MQLKILFLGTFLFWAQMSSENTAFSSITSVLQAKASDYVGTWVGYTANGSEFKIVLREQKGVRFANGKYYDVIMGKHSYLNKEKDVINESLSKPKNDFVLLAMPEFDDSSGLDMTFTDRVHHKIVNITLSFIGGNTKSLHWLFKSETETITINAKEKTLRGISVPTDLILKKVD